MEGKIEDWVDQSAVLTVLAHFHPNSQSGIKGPLRTGMRCPCFSEVDSSGGGYTAVFGFEGDVWPGQEAKAVLQFVMGGEAVEALIRYETFYLGHRGYIGWARILSNEPIPRLRKGWARVAA